MHVLGTGALHEHAKSPGNMTVLETDGEVTGGFPDDQCVALGKVNFQRGLG